MVNKSATNSGLVDEEIGEEGALQTRRLQSIGLQMIFQRREHLKVAKERPMGCGKKIEGFIRRWLKQLLERSRGNLERQREISVKARVAKRGQPQIRKEMYLLANDTRETAERLA